MSGFVNTYTTAGPGRPLSGEDLVAAIDAARAAWGEWDQFLSDQLRVVTQSLAFPRRLLIPLEGEVRLERLGPDHAQFKIVRLPGGRRVIVDQDEEVRDPFQVNFRTALLAVPWVQESRHFMRVCDS